MGREIDILSGEKKKIDKVLGTMNTKTNIAKGIFKRILQQHHCIITCLM